MILKIQKRVAVCEVPLKSFIAQRRKLILIVAASLAFATKAALSVTTYGTNDILFWEADIRKIQSDGGLALYRDGAVPTLGGKHYGVERFNQPPFMVHAFRAGGVAAAVSGIPFRVWLRITCAAADIGILLLVRGIMGIGSQLALSRLLPVALSPVLILVSGFHGNTDSVMVLFLLLSIYLVQSGRPAWQAGAALGMAANIKVIPLIFVPVILMYLPTTRRRVEFALSAAGIWLAGSMPYFARDPALVFRSVFGYSGVSNYWGLSAIASLISGDALKAYRAFGKPLALAAALVASWGIHLWAGRASLFLRCAFIAFLFLFVLSGFGTQYLVWLAPWSAVFPWRKVRWHYALSSVFLCAYYGLWSRGKWYLANTLEVTPHPPKEALVAILAVACWVSVGAMVIVCGQELRKQLGRNHQSMSGAASQ
jgi:hypothetical protein